VVASTLDGLVTNDMIDPGELPSTVPEGGGNQVIIDHGNGQFSAYLHMQAGSLAVEEGDTVERGQLLGLLGNSGHSSAPHLHFQLGTTNSIGSGEGLPFVFDEFELLGTFENGLIDVIPDAQGDQVAAIPPPDGPGPRTNELPLDVTLIDFAE
jgi:murein DD-endopeptidase MepM/ murein hydrolase activator NlpD